VNFLENPHFRSVIEQFSVEQWMLDYAQSNQEYNQGFTINEASFNLKIKPIINDNEEA
jgi:hypothetical protein